MYKDIHLINIYCDNNKNAIFVGTQCFHNYSPLSSSKHEIYILCKYVYNMNGKIGVLLSNFTSLEL